MPSKAGWVSLRKDPLRRPVHLPEWLKRWVPRRWRRRLTVRVARQAVGVLLLGAILFILLLAVLLIPQGKPAVARVSKAEGLLWEPQKGLQAMGLPPSPPVPDFASARAHQELMAISTRRAEAEGALAALAEAEALAALNPASSQLQHHAGVMALSLGDKEKARYYFEAATRAGAPSPGSTFNLAQMDFGEGRYESAARHYQSLLALKPDHEFAKYRLLFSTALAGGKPDYERWGVEPASLPGMLVGAAKAMGEGDRQRAEALLRAAKATYTGLTGRFQKDIELLERLSAE